MTKRTMLKNPFALDLGFLDLHLSASRLNPIFTDHKQLHHLCLIRVESRVDLVRVGLIVGKNSGGQLVVLEEVVDELGDKGGVRIELSTWNGAESPEVTLIASGNGSPPAAATVNANSTVVLPMRFVAAAAPLTVSVAVAVRPAPPHSPTLDTAS
ncbi:hypothetical protein ACFX2J_034927 [Malus domestica]